MRFPKPLVYFGFFLISAAILAGVYDSFFKSSEQSEDPRVTQRRVVAAKVVDGLFENLKVALTKDGYEVKEKDLLEFKKIHKPNYISKYLIIAQELASGKYSKEESLQKDRDFTVQSMNQLTKVYIRKYKLAVKEP